MTAKSKDEILDQMDADAELARPGLAKIRENHPEAIAELAEWWRQNYGAAGHTRLACLLLGRPMPPRKNAR